MLNQKMIRQSITECIMAASQAGVIPWRKPWSAISGAVHCFLFVSAPMPGFHWTLEWVREARDGRRCKADKSPREGWLRPTRIRHFETAPVE